ncbi:hypothetical protein [Ancylobacter polymorphus]|uniref:Uncharacterized protein n=1 Tax=Ancylobacter polymorphus TaxID=223390 RepID=A0ABU0BHI2_9HYPH|nr:hypothetical protein [Ancylobacter polymorphus]MDQ0305300.1 hypothetical protein [Ancylobacter polymorphus]
MAQHDDQFWMVYGLGQRPPAVRHPTEQSAADEAKRLARLNPGIRFYVLEPVSVSVKQDIETVDLRAHKSSVEIKHPLSPTEKASVSKTMNALFGRQPRKAAETDDGIPF